MGSIFGKTINEQREAWEQEKDGIITELQLLRAEITGLRREKENWGKVNELEAETQRLQKKLVDLEIKKSQADEEHARKIRETEHLVGLQRKKQEFDVESARRTAILEVREENLSKDQERFASEMKFQREHLQGEVNRIEKILSEVMGRLPSLQATLELTAGGKQKEE